MKIIDKIMGITQKNQRAIMESEDKVYLPCNVLFGNLKRQKAEKENSKTIKSF